MGGLVVQKYLEGNPAQGAVLMASVPPQGMIGAAVRLARQQPMALLKSILLLRLQPFIGSCQLVRELFFTAETPQEIVDHCFMHLQDESYLAFIDTMIVLPRPRHIQVPILVLGAERDAFLTLSEVRDTARAYRTEPKMFTGMGHDMMLDQGWRHVASRIDDWIRCCEHDGVFARIHRHSANVGFQASTLQNIMRRSTMHHPRKELPIVENYGDGFCGAGWSNEATASR
jgi:alpha-beta hydrolase superfamily lysophospholipase